MEGSASNKRDGSPSATGKDGEAVDPIARLVAERGATMPKADLLQLARRATTPPAGGRPSLEVLNEMREERL
jgi:hypothetical protein